MADSFDPIEYVEYLRKRWRPIGLAVIVAVGVAIAACLLLPKQYTATATLVIEPPGGDPRSTTAVSPVYLESLKSYESLATSDSLFAKACEKFHLLGGKDAPSLESFKRRVLRVEKVKDTNVLKVSVTLPDPGRAQALAEYFARETVSLDRDIARFGDQELLDKTRRQTEQARKDLNAARAEAVSAAGPEPVLESAVKALQDRKARAEEERMEVNMILAENTAHDGQESTAANRAGVATLTDAITAMQRELDEKSAELIAVRARRQIAGDQLRSVEGAFDRVEKLADEASGVAMLRAEQLRVVDPGVVPQRPSFPNLPLVVISAVLIAALLSLVWFTLQFGLMRGREQPVRAAALMVAKRGER